MEQLARISAGVFNKRQCWKLLEAEGQPINNETMKVLTIDTDVWEPNPEKQGYLRFVRQRTVGEVLKDLQEYLPHYVPDYKEVSEGMSYCWWGGEGKRINKEDDFPQYHFLSCYLITGTSEGHYIHVDTIDRDGKRQSIFQEKTFSGSAKGWEIVQAIATILEA